MAISLASLNRASAPKPPRILIHGVHGVGKTTFAAGAPDPVFVLTEDGLGTLDVPHFPLARTFDEVMQALAALYTEEHGFRTLVVDSVDWLEPLIHARVCKDQGWSSIEDAGYGKGYVAAVDPWRQYLEGLNALRDDKGMAIVQLAHTDIKRFDSPESEPYDRYIIKLHSKASALLQEHSDIVLFANYRVSTIKSDVGFNKKVTRALGSGERLLHTAERPAFIAKNRYALPETLPMSWPRSPRRCLAQFCLTRRRTDMAKLGGTFDAASVEPNAPLEALPPGDYKVQILQSEMRPTKAGTGQMLWLDMEVLKGPLKGRHVYDQLNLNPNPTVEEIAQRTLSAICHAIGKLQVSDSEELHFQPLLVRVAVKPNGYNEVKGYKPVAHTPVANGPVTGPAASPVSPAAAQARPAPAANATAPWKRSA
jgi:hypothetical protein